jgi:C-terminal processing protease CtpA/Prc
VQLTWDETMAQNVARYLDGAESRRMIVFAGKGHVAGRSGIPNRVTRRTGIEGVTIATFNPASRMFNTADYMVLANDESLPPAGLMRVFLDETEDGVFIRDFSPGSPAKEAGVKKNDRIARINGRPIRYFADVKLQMLDKRPGDEIEVETVRESLIMGEEFNVARFKLAGEQSGHHAG